MYDEDSADSLEYNCCTGQYVFHSDRVLLVWDKTAGIGPTQFEHIFLSPVGLYKEHPSPDA